MEQCYRCEKTEKEVRLSDAIYENEIVKICERCAIVEGIPIIKKPTTSQLKDSERSYSVYQRLKRISGSDKKEEKHESILDQLRKLEEHPELEEPEEKRPFNLIENFHWHLMRERRNRGLSQKQLGWAIGESEAAIKMIEKQELPEDADKLIRKLEQFLQIRLRERTALEIEEEERKRREKLRGAYKIPDAETEELESETISFQELEPIKPLIREPELDELDIAAIASGRKVNEEDEWGLEEPEEERIIEPARILTFKPEALQGIKIADLKTLKEERERTERLESLEEKRKIALQADSLVRSMSGEEGENRRKQELKEQVASEMKDFATGKTHWRGEEESIEEKKKILSKAVGSLGKKEEKKKERVPTIYELSEKKKQKDEDAMTGSEIELDDFEDIDKELNEEFH